MLRLLLEEQEFFDDKTNRFYMSKPTTVILAHSLISISKWESLSKRPFLPSSYQPGMTGPGDEISYIKCMLVKPVPDNILSVVYNLYRDRIYKYINDPMTATIIGQIGSSRLGTTRTITSEVIYYWMIKFGIPHEFEKWHLNRLIALISVCSTNENSDKKGSRMTAAESAVWRAKLNDQRLGR